MRGFEAHARIAVEQTVEQALAQLRSIELRRGFESARADESVVVGLVVIERDEHELVGGAGIAAHAESKRRSRAHIRIGVAERTEQRARDLSALLGEPQTPERCRRARAHERIGVVCERSELTRTAARIFERRDARDARRNLLRNARASRGEQRDDRKDASHARQ